MSQHRAVVLHSGGQDSTTCLAWALKFYGPENVYPVSISYGQRHDIELACAERVLQELDAPNPAKLYDLRVLSQLSGAALTNPDIDVSADAAGTGNAFAEEHGLPSTFVPGRNLLFFTVAMAHAAQMGIYNIVTGVCEADAAGYPDCRRVFVESAERALIAALDDPRPRVIAPLLDKSKAETFAFAEELGVLDVVLEYTNTCYHGSRDHRFNWGYGCGECPACQERARGWVNYQATLPESQRID